MNTTSRQFQNLCRSLGFAAAATALAFVLARPCSAQAEAPALAPTMSLVSGSTVTQGEPIVLQYRVSNLGTWPILGWTRWGGQDHMTEKDGQDWLTETLTDANGVAVPQVKQYSPQQFATGFGVEIPQFLVPASGAYVGYTVINQKFALPHAGRYTLRVRMRLGYNDALTDATGDGSNAPPDAPGVITQTFTYPILITPMDTARLTSIAHSLTASLRKTPATSQAASRPLPFEEKAMRTRALFSLPDSVAAPFWQEAARQDSSLATELYQVHTLAAAQVLASIVRLSPNAEETRRCQNWLDRLCETSTGALKSNVLGVYPKYELNTPETRIRAY